MKNRTLILSTLALGAALFFSAGDALADGTSTKPSALPAGARVSLEKDIAAARASNPSSFAAVAAIDGHKPEVYNKYRKPMPTTEREFRRLGAPALMAMIEALAFKAPARGAATEAEWNALQVGLLEGIGVVRDVRAAPVLEAVFEGGNAPIVTAAAARALGRLGGDAELSLVAKHAVAGDPLFAAAIEGLGECRRVESAKLLADLLGSTKDAAVAESIVVALGRLSSSWAWKTLGAAQAANGLAAREIAAKAFVGAFAGANEPTRDAIRRGLFMAEHPSTLQLIDSARASAATIHRPAFDALRARVAARTK